MFGISSFEFFVIIFFAFLVFGPEKLPEIGRILGRAIKQFREASETMSKTIQTEVTDPFQEAMQPYQETIQETVAPLQEDIQAINQTMRETEDAIKEPFKELANPMGTDSYDKAGRKRGKYGRTSKHTSHNVREGTKPSLFGAQKSDKQKAKEAGTVDFGHVRTEEDNISGRREDDLLSDANLKKANERVKAREEGGSATAGDAGSTSSTTSTNTSSTNTSSTNTSSTDTVNTAAADSAPDSAAAPEPASSPESAAPKPATAPDSASAPEPAAPEPSALAASLYGLDEDDEVPSTRTASRTAANSSSAGSNSDSPKPAATSKGGE